jgi:hypothetical protein
LNGIPKKKVQLLTWNEKSEQNSCELLAQEEILKGARQGGGGEKPVSLMQVKGNLNTLDFFCQNPSCKFAVCLPANRSNPILVILASTFVSVCPLLFLCPLILAFSLKKILDFKSRKRLFNEPTVDILTGNTKKSLKATPFSRGFKKINEISEKF